MILTGIALIPWKIGELVKQLLKTSKQTAQEILCTNCGLTLHDADARFCKVCGKPIVKAGASCEIPGLSQELSTSHAEHSYSENPP